MIPESFVNDLVARSDIVDVISRSVALKKQGQNFSGLCPFHNEKTPSFSVSGTKQFYKCFGCGESGGVLKFLMRATGRTFPEAVEYLAEISGLEVPREGGLSRNRQVAVNREQLGDAFDVALAFYRRSLPERPPNSPPAPSRFALGFAPKHEQPLSAAFPDYLTNKKLVDAGLSFDSDGKRVDTIRDRFVVPVMDAEGKVCGFIGRAKDGRRAPTIIAGSASVLPRGRHVFGLVENADAIAEAGMIRVVEDPWRVVKESARQPVPVVAPLETLTPGHYAALIRTGARLVFHVSAPPANEADRFAQLSSLPALVQTLTAVVRDADEVAICEDPSSTSSCQPILLSAAFNKAVRQIHESGGSEPALKWACQVLEGLRLRGQMIGMFYTKSLLDAALFSLEEERQLLNAAHGEGDGSILATRGPVCDAPEISGEAQPLRSSDVALPPEAMRVQPPASSQGDSRAAPGGHAAPFLSDGSIRLHDAHGVTVAKLALAHPSALEKFADLSPEAYSYFAWRGVGKDDSPVNVISRVVQLHSDGVAFTRPDLSKALEGTAQREAILTAFAESFPLTFQEPDRVAADLSFFATQIWEENDPLAHRARLDGPEAPLPVGSPSDIAAAEQPPSVKKKVAMR